MSDLALDLKFAFRAAVKNPVFTLVVVVTLALGIGANTALFSLLDQVLLQPLPVKEPERLVVLSGPGPYSGGTHSHSATLTPFSHPMFEGLRDQNTVFDGVLGHFPAAAHLAVGGQTDEVKADLVSGNFFQVLGLAPAAGRLFTRDDDRTPGAHAVIVLSHGFWTRRFGNDPSVVGRAMEVNNAPMTVVGVAPLGFNGVEVGEAIDIFVPLMMQASVVPTWEIGLGNWRARWVTIMARLKPNITVAQAEAGAAVLYRQLLEEDFKTVKTTSETLRARFFEKKLQILPGCRGTSGLRD